MNRVDRLVAIILLLQSHRIIRARDIAEHFSISIRTVYRDMGALDEAGVPIAAEAGEGYSLVQGYHLPPVMFTHEEAGALFLGGKFVEKMTDASMRCHAESALLKIKSVLPEKTKRYLERLDHSTALYLRHPSQPDSAFRDDVLQTIQEAIVGSRVLFLEYYTAKSDAFSERRVEPLGLVYYADHWHLIAYCRLRKNYRDFRTDRIKTIRLREETYFARPGFSLKEYLKNFMRVDGALEVKALFDKRVAAHVKDKHYHGLVEETLCGKNVLMTFLTPSLSWIAFWLLSYGRYVTVVSPESLKDILRFEAKNILEKYSARS